MSGRWNGKGSSTFMLMLVRYPSTLSIIDEAHVRVAEDM
jgi:hypothetical protein